MFITISLVLKLLGCNIKFYDLLYVSKERKVFPEELILYVYWYN